MQIFVLFKDSWKTALRFYPAALWIWLLTLLSVFPVFRLVHRSLAAHYGSTAVPEIWLQEFDLAYLMEWSIEAPFLFPAILAVSIAMLLIYSLAMIWANGGVIGSLLEECKENKKRLTFARFSGHGGHLFSRYFRLSLMMLPLILVSLIPLSFGWVGLLFTAAFLLLWVMAGDLTKIELARSQSGNVFQVFLRSLKMLFLRGRIIILYYLLALLALAGVYFIYHFIDQAMIADSGIKILFLALLQQLWIFWRAMVRIQLFSVLELQGRQWITVTANQSLVPQIG